MGVRKNSISSYINDLCKYTIISTNRYTRKYITQSIENKPVFVVTVTLVLHITTCISVIYTVVTLVTVFGGNVDE